MPTQPATVGHHHDRIILFEKCPEIVTDEKKSTVPRHTTTIGEIIGGNVYAQVSRNRVHPVLAVL